jgi:hypothetical protein
MQICYEEFKYFIQNMNLEDAHIDQFSMDEAESSPDNVN